MRVLKFGGTSVGSQEAITQVIGILRSSAERDERPLAVASAMQGITNALLEAGKQASAGEESYRSSLEAIEQRHYDVARRLMSVRRQSSVLAGLKKMLNELDDLLHGVYLLRELSPRTQDLILSFGERLSCFLIAAYGDQEGLHTIFIDARPLIRTDDRFGNARVDMEATRAQVRAWYDECVGLPVVTGFIGSTDKGETTTLGRGGSDYSAALLAACLNAEELQIWTDVDGVMTSDPKRVKKAFPLMEMTYEEAMEMSHFGAKVIYPPTLQPVLKARIPLRILNTFNRDFPGTLVHEKVSDSPYPVKGISSISEVSLINFQGSGMVGVAGVSSRLFGVLARNHISVILITQASSEHSICFAIEPKDAALARRVIGAEFDQEIRAGKIDEMVDEPGMSVVAIIGDNMQKTPGIAGRMFMALGKNGVNVVAIAQGSSERNLSVVIGRQDLAKALNVIHDAFFLSDVKTLNVFMAGTGLIGRTLLAQIAGNQDRLLRQQLLRINLAGLCNRSTMLLDPDGINLSDWQSTLNLGSPAALEQFAAAIKNLNLANTVFVDCTASEAVVDLYEDLISHSVSVVTPNKIASSGDLARFHRLKESAVRRGVRYMYETNVGAGLPVITTLNNLRDSGDRIRRIEGVLSGTLSYLFNTLNPDRNFSAVVRDARERGFTEPDPRDDLNGLDVARKILILSREIGYTLDLADVQVEPLLPESCYRASDIEEFFEELESMDAHFGRLAAEAAQKGERLRYIARLEDGQASIRLRSVGAESPFYHLSGSDNMISFTTDRYCDTPLVVQGPGAGAEVTAAGVFAEIISLGSFLS
jgi:bifunctional aspartokinase / homoserine dehydrogenase 1